MDIRIGSFNLYKFGRNNTKKDISTIAQIIKDKEIDILAIQEIFHEDVMNNILRELGAYWKGKWASPPVHFGSSISAEGYAFIWNTQRFNLSQNKEGKVFEPRILSQYPHTDKILGNLKLIRDPLYGRFTLNANKMIEIRLINTHIIYSKNIQINDSDERNARFDRIGDITMRKREFNILATKILPKIDNKDFDAQYLQKDKKARNPYTIMLGDYNLNLEDSGAKGAYIEKEGIEVLDANSRKVITTVQKDLSTLKLKTKNNPDNVGYSNNFDHFTYDSERPISTAAYAVKIPSERQYGLDFDSYKENISDHLMVILDIDFI